MATRAEVSPFPRQRARASSSRMPPPIYTGRDRLLFVLALLTFSVALFYMSAGLLIRAYPAVFPGETVPIIGNVLKPLGPVAPRPPGADSIFNKRVNLLILGLDKRPYEPFAGPYRTDTIMVATIDPVSKDASLLSFPRDLLVTVDTPQWQADLRINQSYVEGFQQGGSIEAAAKQVQHDLEYNFGIQTDHWLVMDFVGVEDLINAVGGVDVVIDDELYVPDWWYNDEGERPSHWISFYPGEYHLSGYEAVAFGRYRNDSDLKRVKRQQLVVQAAIDKVFSLNLLNNPIELYSAYKDLVKHDVALGEMPGLARLLAGSRGNIQTYSLGDKVDGNDTVWGYEVPSTGALVLLYDADNVAYWLNKAFPKAAYSGAAVEVQNGFGDDGRARIEALGRYLRFAKGLPTVYLGPPQEIQAATSIVLLREGRREVAEDIAEWLGIPASAITTRTPPDDSAPDVIVTIGQDFILPDR